MTTLRGWPAGERLETAELVLEPLRVEHAEEMVSVLADPLLYTFTGGRPPSVEELRERYRRQSLGRSSDGTERWFNWVLRHRVTRRAVGYVQATVRIETAEEDDHMPADGVVAEGVVADGVVGDGVVGDRVETGPEDDVVVAEGVVAEGVVAHGVAADGVVGDRVETGAEDDVVVADCVMGDGVVAGLVVAEVAWLVATVHQGRGHARRAVAAMVSWLRAQGADRIVAHVHPGHRASAAVAASTGMRPTDLLVDGEVRWVG